MVGHHMENILTNLGLTPEEFADTIGVGKSSVYKIIRGDTKKFTRNIAEKINDVFPQFSVQYILSLNKNDKPPNEDYFQGTYKLFSTDFMTSEQLTKLRKESKLTQQQLADMCGMSRKTINNYETKGNIPNSMAKLFHGIFQLHGVGKSSSILKEPEAIWVSYERFKLVPLVTHRAHAGFLSGWGDEEYIEGLPKVPWEVDREYKGRYMTFEVSGESMESDFEPRESLYEGDLLLCREVQRHHWTNKLHIHKWDFVIVHRIEGILVKRIKEHNTENGILTLHSLNPLYDDFKVNIDDLIAIFNIVDVKRNRRR